MMTAPARIAMGAVSAMPIPGGLRDIAVGGEVVFRGISFVARDAHWGTYRLDATFDVASTGDQAVITWAGYVEQAGGGLRWQARFSVSPGGLVVCCEAVGEGLFETNRTGLVVLHALAATRGRMARALDPQGHETLGRFPELVSPHQPFRDLAALHYDTAAGTAAGLRFEGDIFETEDQRNWTDASYKTYGRPLRWPIPYHITADAPVRQSVRVDFAASSPPLALPDVPYVRAMSPMPALAPALGPAPGPFAGFNRAVAPGAGGCCAWSASPTVHADDDDTVGETIEALPDLIATVHARVMAPRISVGPVRLEMQFGPLPPAPDPRRGSLIEAAWILGSIAGLLDPAVERIGFDVPIGAAAVLLDELGRSGGIVSSWAWNGTPRLRALSHAGRAGGAPVLFLAHAAATICTPVLPDGNWSLVSWLGADGFTTPQPRVPRFAVTGFAVARLTGG